MWLCLCMFVHTAVRVRFVHLCLTTQPVNGSLSSDALLLSARPPGDVEQRSQEVTCGCCVKGSSYAKREEKKGVTTLE